MAKQNEWWGYWRLSKYPSHVIPFGVRSVGRTNAKPGWQCPSGLTEYVVLFWCQKGTIEVIVDNQKYFIGPNQVFCIYPQSTIQGVPINDEVDYRWVTLDGAKVVDIVAGFGFKKSSILPTCECPVSLFNQMEELLKNALAQDEYDAMKIAFQILTDATQFAKEINLGSVKNISQTILSLIDLHYMDKDFNVEKLSKIIKKNRSYTSRVFKEQTGLNIIDAIKQRRIDKALLSLLNSNDGINEISNQCGFADVSYFVKCIKKATNFTPSKYRAHHWSMIVNKA